MTNLTHQLSDYITYDPEEGSLFRKDLNRYVGTLSKVGYYTFTFNKKSYYNHRVAFYLMVGRWPTQVDHINGLKTDNRWINLREVTSRQQATNKVGWSKSGYKGVSWSKVKEKYHSRVRFMDKVYHVGYFDDILDAKRAYDLKAQQLHEEYFNDKHRTSAVSVP